MTKKGNLAKKNNQRWQEGGKPKIMQYVNGQGGACWKILEDDKRGILIWNGHKLKIKWLMNSPQHHRWLLRICPSSLNR